MLDLAKVRAFYFRPSARRDRDRVPTSEELYAQYERRRVEECIRRGGRPDTEGLGEHGSLIGGPGKPLTVFPVRPDRALPQDPLPLAWFDSPLARSAPPYPRTTAEANAFFAHLSGAHLAGMPNRPTGAQLARLFRATELSSQERSQLWHIFADIQAWDLTRLLYLGGLSLYELACAIHLSGSRRATVVTWLNQFGVPPRDRARTGSEPV